MDDQRSLRATLSATRKRGSFRPGMMMGGVSGLALVSSIIVYDGFTHAAPSINTFAPEPSRQVIVDHAPERSADPVPTSVATISAPTQNSTMAKGDAPVREQSAGVAKIDDDDVGMEDSAAAPQKLAAIATPTTVTDPITAPSAETKTADLTTAPSPSNAPENREPVNQKVALATSIAEQPRIETMPRERGVPAAVSSVSKPATTPASNLATRPDEFQPGSTVAVAKVEPTAPSMPSGQIDMSVDFKEIEIALAPTGSTDVTSARTAPSVLDAPRAPVDLGERGIPKIEVSMASTNAFDLDPTRGSDFAVLVEPTSSVPATPELNVNPAASFAAPLDALTAAPHARTPVLKAPAVVAVLGAEPPVGLLNASEPSEVSVLYQSDRGRDEARVAVMSDEDSAWRRHRVAPRANPENLPVLAIVIDEVGAYGAPIEEVVALSPMVTTSVIPSTPDSALIASQLRASGREVLVHMPMETYADFKEGPRPILKKMTDEEVRDTARWHLSQFSGYVGVNNHLGSRATRAPRVMEALMAELSSRGLMFLDSRTSTKSLAEKAALDAGMLATRNHRFIDNDVSIGAIMGELNAAAALARRHGAAVALGNPHPATVRAVKRWIEQNDGKKVMVAPITHVAGVINAKSEVTVAGK